MRGDSYGRDLLAPSNGSVFRAAKARFIWAVRQNDVLELAEEVSILAIGDGGEGGRNRDSKRIPTDGLAVWGDGSLICASSWSLQSISLERLPPKPFGQLPFTSQIECARSI